MKLDEKLLKLKNISPLQKLILGLIIDVPPIVLQFEGGYSNTCTEIAKELGTTRTKILKEFHLLVELDYITTEVYYCKRLTNLTQKFNSILNIEESIIHSA